LKSCAAHVLARQWETRKKGRREGRKKEGRKKDKEVCEIGKTKQED
jgi:hypothetical protein